MYLSTSNPCNIIYVHLICSGCFEPKEAGVPLDEDPIHSSKELVVCT